ncbi:glycosyltransferase [Pedobacter sp. L105]|uniref:glycosyltransferase n=1 Tax=Pedobacter sp. L105 TaxID=1641871 RepID=UPI00131DBFD4|nr:glycosyltransferase [Pedobacter sp. L105]
MPLAYKVDYSIIICTYNPDEKVFSRCLDAISTLDSTALQLEIILVDNNSTIAITELKYVRDFLSRVPETKLLLVKEQGLNYARMAGIEESAGECIVFFDDDNVPDRNYIQVLAGLNKNYPNVGAWGPGSVDVNFIGGIDPSLETYALTAFQDRHERAITYSNQRLWQPCYPYGTGLSIQKVYLEEYLSLAKQNKFSLTGRKGEQTSSGEDTQMILFCISKGAAAGVAPDLKIIHVVPAKRTTFDYLKRWTYGTTVCYSTCVAEVFPEYILELEKKRVSERSFVIKTLRRYILLFFAGNPKKTFRLVSYIGMVSGDYKVLNLQEPFLVKWVLKKLKAI